MMDVKFKPIGTFKELGPAMSKTKKTNLSGSVDMQNPIAKEWNPHRTVTEVLSPCRYKVYSEIGRNYMRNGKFFYPSAHGQEHAPAPILTLTSAPMPPTVPTPASATERRPSSRTKQKPAW